MLIKKVEQDEYGDVINSFETFDGLAEILEKHTSVVFGWTDEEGSHLDILMTVQPIQVGSLQGGQHGTTDLFVSVMRFGAFGFEIKNHESSSGYVAEKLTMGEPNVTTQKLADLINGVRNLL